MLYSCTHTATVVVKGLVTAVESYQAYLSRLYILMGGHCQVFAVEFEVIKIAGYARALGAEAEILPNCRQLNSKTLLDCMDTKKRLLNN